MRPTDFETVKEKANVMERGSPRDFAKETAMGNAKAKDSRKGSGKGLNSVRHLVRVTLMVTVKVRGWGYGLEIVKG